MELNEIFKALGDENRLSILNSLTEKERCACHILEELEISQPTVSHHLKLLCEVELITCRVEGKWKHYQINPNKIRELIQYLERLIK